jgi:double zinc ribbon protein
MVSSLCPFCQHSNPAVAKFCNDCGSPLTLKPCNQCGAVNDRAAKNCHECHAELTETPRAPEPELISSSAEAADSISSSHRMDFAPTPMPSRRSAPDTVGLFAGRLAASAEVGAEEDQPVDGHVIKRPSALRSVTRMVNLSKLAPASVEYRWPRAALIAGVVVVVAVSGYYVNHNQAQYNPGMSEPDPGAPTTAALGPPSSSPPTKIEVPTNSAQPLGSGGPSAIGVADRAFTATEASAGSTSEVPAAASESAKTPTTQPQSVNDDSLAQPPVPRADPAQPSSPNAMAADTAHETRQSASQVNAARTPGGRSTKSSPASTAALLQQQGTEAPSEAPRVSVCTDAVAALGFCNMKNNQAGNN